MENPDITLLKQLNSSTVEFTIKVRILKLWREPSRKIPTATYAIHLIFMDEEGDKIEASLPNLCLTKFDKNLIEKECFYIRNLTVQDNRSKSRLVNRPHKLSFNLKTELKKCNNFAGCMYGFSFVGFDLLRNNEIPDDSPVDIIGYIYTYFEMCDHITPTGGVSKKMSIQLRDLQNNHLFVTLWESHAERMSKHLSKQTDRDTTVMILQFGRYKFVDGRAFVSTAFQGSSLYINEDINDITTYKTRLVEQECNQSSSNRRLVPSQIKQVSQDELWTTTAFNTLAEVNTADEVKSVIVMGEIKSFEPGAEWYYNGCKRCTKKVVPEYVIMDASDGPKTKRISVCPTPACNNNVISTTPKFRIVLTIDDNTDVVHLTLFDTDAKKLLGTSAEELVDKIVDVNAVNVVPRVIGDLVGRKFAFKIDITHYNLSMKSKYFTIKKYTEDSAILSKLQGNLQNEQVEHSESNNIRNIESDSQEIINLETQKQTRLPIMETSNGTSSSMNDKNEDNTTTGKRKLTDMYDVDECARQPSCRPRQMSVEETIGFSSTHASVSMTENPTKLNMAKQRRQIRKQYLDSRKSNAIFVRFDRQIKVNETSTNNYFHTTKSKYTSVVDNVPGPSTSMSIRMGGNSNPLNMAFANLKSKQARMLRKLYLRSRKTKALIIPNTIHTPSMHTNARMGMNPNYNTNLSSGSHYCHVSATLSAKYTAANMAMYKNDGKENRRLRKRYIDSRKSNHVPLLDVCGPSIAKDMFIGVSKDYLDHHEQSVTCNICHAKLWKDEAARGKSRDKGNTSYSLCCAYGKVELPDLKKAPQNYQHLYNGFDSQSKFFLKNIRRYNSIFAFTSMGGKVDSSINRGNAPYVYRLGGQNFHSIGSLLPEDGCKPKFSQLYIYDTDNELPNRQTVCGDSNNTSTSASQELDLQIIQQLKMMLDTENVLVQTYRMVRDCFKQNPHLDLKLRLIGKRQHDGRTYNLPTTSEVAALIVGDIGDSSEPRDIVVKTRSGGLQRISELHPSYLALQYPLLFPYGDDCYRTDIPHRGMTHPVKTNRVNCTMREFFAYRIQDRTNVFSLILNSRRLFQQFLVDAYTMIETERLNYIRHKQNDLRSESYESLRNLRNRGDTDMSHIGKRVILPSSFTGGARYMMQNYLDALSICKWYGYPDFFITVTCNPKWPEVRRFLKDTTLNPEDRPDILCRLFKIKLDALIKDLKDNSLLGKVSAVVYTVEFQKRGLPHAHICLFMHPEDKFPTVEHIDPLISAEIPNKDEDLELYTLVSDFMIHGPCGHHNMNSPCMTSKKCSKHFPKKFRDHTSIDSSGFPLYRRRDCGRFVEKSGVNLDNRSVVPYNKQLLKRYQAHINVEWCNQEGSIKYLFKYINKGPDRVTVSVVQSNTEDAHEPPVDEIRKYYDCRYLSACEASWRIFSYDVHYRRPSVIRLPFHLPNQQNVVYGAEDDIDNVLNNPSVASSMFLSWMDCNRDNEEARNLTYIEFPTKFVWKHDQRCWSPRQRGFSIGRIYSVPPSLGEAYFLRILLNKVKGPTSFDDILTVNGHKFETFRQTCYALGLLDDDMEYVEAIQEASHAGSGHYVRTLFATLLTSNSLSRPEFVWQKTWELLSDGILHRQRLLLRAPDLFLHEDQLKNLTLYEIEKILNRANSTLRNWNTMPYPDHESVSSSNNRLITEQLDYDITSLEMEFNELSTALTTEQRSIFNEITKAAEDNKGGVFFIYGYGGTGKTFLWKTLSAYLRSKRQIVLNVASSGIASLLLTGGRTTHSRFLLPFNLNEDSICSIKPNTEEAMLLRKTSLIIWDEAPMVHRHGFEALDKCLKDILTPHASTNSQPPFGGKTIVFGGDFRQILPVIQGGTRQDIVNASLTSSYIWANCTVRRLTKNMRLTVGTELQDLEKTKAFAQWLLELGEGHVGGPNDGEAIVDIPDDLLITESSDPISDLIDFVYPSILQNCTNHQFFRERAILAPTNEIVDELNDRFLSTFPGDEKEYLSSDTICQSEDLHDGIDQNLYSPDVLNGLKISGLPNHKLVLKVGVPVMLLRNIDQRNGLCNGTRLQVLSLGTRVIEAKVISGSNIGDRTFIPRIGLTPSDKKIPFKFQRRQFPLAVCFAMTINKSQGQSLSRVGLFLKQPVFSHGQLYVALSRVKSREGLKLLILDKDGSITNNTTNVVYKEVLMDL